jgi:hypothetical protein
LSLTRNDFNQVVHIENSEHEERSWHYLHADPETILLGNWYRPGATIHDGYMHLISEIEMHSAESTGIILSGDLNIHHARWLRHSNGNASLMSRKISSVAQHRLRIRNNCQKRCRAYPKLRQCTF